VLRARRCRREWAFARKGTHRSTFTSASSKSKTLASRRLHEPALAKWHPITNSSTTGPLAKGREAPENRGREKRVVAVCGSWSRDFERLPGCRTSSSRRSHFPLPLISDCLPDSCESARYAVGPHSVAQGDAFRRAVTSGNGFGASNPGCGGIPVSLNAFHATQPLITRV